MSIKAGYYKGRAIPGSAQHGYAKDGVSEQIAVDLQLETGDRVTTVLSFNGGAVPYSIERLKALGWDGSNELNGIDRNEVEVQIKYEVPPGKTEEVMRAEIKTKSGRFTFNNQMNEQQKRGFMSNLSNLAKQYENGTPPAPQVQQQPRVDASGTNFPHGANAPPQQNYKL